MLLAFLTLCILGVHLALTTVFNQAEPLPEKAEHDIAGDGRRYGVVIDAGSSGSRAMLYTWDDPGLQANQSSGLPVVGRVSGEWAFKTDRGISSFVNDPREVGEQHIKPLLDFAQEHIPAEQIPHTPVVLLATAGMRLLPDTHRAQILDMACGYAQAHYDFAVDCPDGFQVVSGELEGLYGWVAVNYLMDGFVQEKTSTHGFLDMGGASAQIAYEPGEAASSNQSDLALVTLRGLDGSDRTHGVFVATFLGHGTNEARRRYVEQIKKTAKGTPPAVVGDPCLAPGLVLPSADGQAVLRGQGSFAQCVEATAPLLNKTACATEPCLFGGVEAPVIDFAAQRFVGVSEYWYAAHDYLQLGGVWDVERFEQRAAEFCARPWVDTLAQLTSVTDRPGMAVVGRLQMQCFKAAWLVNVLHDGFGVPRAGLPFESVHNVGDIEVSWTLGALLLKVSRSIPANTAATRAGSRPGIQLPRGRGEPSPDDIDLVDDALWSPLRFVGIRRLLVLWWVQPPMVQLLIVLGLVVVVAGIVALGAWLCARHSASRASENVEALALVDISDAGTRPLAPSLSLKKKLVIMGRSGAGKTSMRSLIFSNYTANDTRRLGATIDVEHSTVQFMGDLNLNIWDCGGQRKYLDNYLNEQKENIFGNVEVLIYVFDLETSNRESEYALYDDCLEKLSQYSPDAKVYCLVHKIDKIPDEEQRQLTVESYRRGLARRSSMFCPDVYGTSIWDQTLYQAWSQIVYKLVPNMELISSHLRRFRELTDAKEVVLFERATFLVVCNSAAARPDMPIDKYMGISSYIKTYRQSCLQHQRPFRSVEVRNKHFSLFLEPFTKSTYILVISADPEVEPAVTKANIEAARPHFKKLADGVYTV
ncbi:Golgi apyrase [Coemansia sp. RSA 552]|nr:Golgi apyrase [Coemansia sp. RSA 552]